VNIHQPLDDKKKERQSHTFVLSESLVLVDYDRVFALGCHPSLQMSVRRLNPKINLQITSPV
jgi:hypothetical protein